MLFHRPSPARLLVAVAATALSVMTQPAFAGTALTKPSPVSIPQAFQTVAAEDPRLMMASTPIVTLRRNTTINGEVVRVGDLFQSTSGNPLPQGHEPVMAAPLVGTPIMLDAVRLAAIAQRYGLLWTPLQVNDMATLTRETSKIDSAEILAVLRGDLLARGMPETAEIDLGSALQSATIAAGQMGSIEMVDANYDRRSGRFSAVIRTGSGNGDTRNLRLSGRAVDTVEVPVLGRALGSKDVIQIEDIQWVRMRVTDLKDNTLLDPDRLIGQTARRPLRVGDQIMTQDLERTLVITKGQSVLMQLVTPSLQLTAHGVALEHGAVGDLIRVRNPQSQKVVTATITGPRQVSVSSLGQVAALNR